MGAARLSQPDLLQGGRQGRPLRRVGGARAFGQRTPGRLQTPQVSELSAGCNLTANGVHMSTTRMMAVAMLIAGSGLVLHVAHAQQSGIKRTDALRHGLGVAPVITVPTITLEAVANGAPHLAPKAACAAKFSGK